MAGGSLGSAPGSAAGGGATAQRAPADPTSDDEVQDDGADPMTQRAVAAPTDDEKDEDSENPT